MFYNYENEGGVFMKRISLLSFIILILFTVEFRTVNADMGPKAFLEVTIVGVEEDYHFDLLVISSDITRYNDIVEPWSYYDEEYYPDVLLTYQDEDMFASYAVFDVPSQIRNDTPNKFEMGYIAPRTFKVVIVMDDNDAVIISKEITTNRFESYITWDLTDVDLNESVSGVGELTGNISGLDLTWENLRNVNWFVTATNTFWRVVLTLVFELGILYLFKFRKKSSFIKVGITNIVTQIALSILVIAAFLNGGMWFYILSFIFLEAIVFIVETIAYMIMLKEKNKPTIFLYTFIANSVTIIMGFVMMITL